MTRLLFSFLIAASTLVLFNSCKDDCDVETTYYIDNDGDGFGTTAETTSACSRPSGYADNANDIDDNDDRLNPNTAWSGTALTFTKAPEADWTLEANQDRLTEMVWLTRQDNRGLFNIVAETEQVGGFSETLSPAGTEWAMGSLSDGLDNLTFDRFVGTLNNNVGDYILAGPMVLHLIEENIYIDITFDSWSMGNTGGGFSYTRSTSN